MREIARGAALVGGVETTLTVQTGYTDMNILESGLKLLQENLTLVGEPSYTAEEQSFARALQKATGKEEVGMSAKLAPLQPIASDPPGGSSDVGDVSWVAPTRHPRPNRSSPGSRSPGWAEQTVARNLRSDSVPAAQTDC